MLMFCEPPSLFHSQCLSNSVAPPTSPLGPAGLHVFFQHFYQTSEGQKSLKTLIDTDASPTNRSTN